MHDMEKDTPVAASGHLDSSEKLAWVPPRLEALDAATHTESGAITGPPENADCYS